MGKKRIVLPLLLSLCAATITPAWATSPQSVTTAKEEGVVSGQVMDEIGQPLPGVTIRIDGTNGGVTSDYEGRFSIKVPKGKSIHVTCSYIGCKTQKLTLKSGEKDVVILMLDDKATLEEVVITGYQQIDRRNLTSSVTSVKMDDIARAGVSSVDKMLQGRIPDLVLSNNSGEINSTPKIRIRGTSTLIGNREPLWVVDGIIINDPVNLKSDVINDPDYINRIGNAISGINPQDIERIDVLKDAAATALYGTRAANGVIVVTTKKGRAGKPVISYSFTGTMRQRPRYTDSKIDLMNSLERTQVSRELANMHYSFPSDMSYVGYEDALQKYYSGVYSRAEFEQAVAAAETQNTDWFKLLTHDSFSQDHNVNISGGADKFRYYASLGYTDDDDVINNNTGKRYTAATNLDFTLNDKFQASLNLSMYTNKKRYNQTELSPIDYAYNTSRTIPAYDSDGNYYTYKKNTLSSGAYDYSFLNELDNSYVSQRTNGFKATMNLRYAPKEWLNFNAILAYSGTNTNIEGWYGERTFHAAALRMSQYGVPAPANSEMPFGGELSEDNTELHDWTARLQANINKDFGANKEHNINIAVGMEASSSRYKGNQFTQRGYYADRGRKFTTSIPKKYASYLNWLATNMPTITDNLTNLASVYGTASYSYKQYFTVNANTRYDGSNRFGDRSNEKILPVWSVSRNANIKEIANINAKWLEALTYKVSYGGQGNMLEGQTPKLTITKGAYDTHYGEMSSTVDKFANPDLKWEKTQSFSTGIEASLFKGRLLFTTEYYYKKTNDAFMNKTISDVNGYTSYIVNSGQIINKGYNFAITATPIQNDDWNWMLSATMAKVMNKMNTAPGEDAYDINDYLDGTAIVNGEPIGSFYSYRFIGLNHEDGAPLFDDWKDRQDELVGLSKYETAMRVLELSGKRDPDITGSLSSTLTYKNWRLGIFMDYSLGNKIRLFHLFNQGIGTNLGPGYIYPENNLNRALLNRWMKPGDEQFTNIPSIMSKDQYGFYNYTSHWSEKSSYQGVTFGRDAWTMYDYSNARVVSADYLRLTSISLTYEVPVKTLINYGLQRMAITITGNNLYTWCNSKLKGQTPTQSGFAEVQLGDNPYYTIGVNIQF